MKKLFIFLLCLVLLCGCLLPAAAQATTTGEAAVPENGPEVMLIICLVILVAGGIYLFFKLRKP